MNKRMNENHLHINVFEKTVLFGCLCSYPSARYAKLQALIACLFLRFPFQG